MHNAVADPGEGPGGPPLPLFLDQTEGPKTFYFETGSPLSKGLDDRPPYLVQGFDTSRTENSTL